MYNNNDITKKYSVEELERADIAIEFFSHFIPYKKIGVFFWIITVYSTFLLTLLLFFIGIIV